jgi:hypothetical protein
MYDIRVSDAAKMSSDMDALVAAGYQAIRGVGDMAIAGVKSNGVNLIAVKGNDFVEVVVNLTGKTSDLMLSTAEQLAKDSIAQL